MLNKSRFITPELLKQVFDAHSATWTKQYITDIPDRVAAVILVLDPAYPIGIAPEPRELWHGVLGEQDPKKWPEGRPYRDFAFAKARAAWRTQMDNHMMLLRPELIQVGDFKFHGGIYRDGLAMGLSGLKTADSDLTVCNEFIAAIKDALNIPFRKELENTSVYTF
jgi:hypothetical protein